MKTLAKNKGIITPEDTNLEGKLQMMIDQQALMLHTVETL